MGELAALEEAYEGSWFLSKGFQRLLDIVHNGTASPWCATAAPDLLLESHTLLLLVPHVFLLIAATQDSCTQHHTHSMRPAHVARASSSCLPICVWQDSCSQRSACPSMRLHCTRHGVHK